MDIHAELTRDQLDQVARELWNELAPKSVVWLAGEIGAGKTTFVQALARAAGAARAVSPTYTLVNEYDSPAGRIIHVDCYRLRHPDEAIDLDFADLIRRSRVVMIEWPERAGRHAPPPDVHLLLKHVDDPERRGLERVA